LVHSDLRADNLLFSPDGASVTIVDWQGVGTGPPGFDLAYLLSQSLTVADRRRHEQDLLDHYRRSLAKAGLTLTDHDIRAGYGESMIYGLAIACALPLISDPDEPRSRALAKQVTRRSIEAMRDHGQLWEARG
jgi:aminoglycoside phosphotransferase (APT) family kinase protein